MTDKTFSNPLVARFARHQGVNSGNAARSTALPELTRPFCQSTSGLTQTCTFLNQWVSAALRATETHI